MDNTSLVSLARAIASGEGCDPSIICAIIEQESNWNQWAIRYEPKFMARYIAPLFTNNKITATEAWSRSFSWGLMQVLGQVAREAGYSGPLAQLCQPEIGILWGCKVWAAKLKKAEDDVKHALLLWNGGAVLEYPVQVLGRLERYK